METEFRWTLPSPFEEWEHTADIGICVEGASLSEAFARAVLAMAQLQAGGAPIRPSASRMLEARGDDRVAMLVDLCRQTLARFFDERLLLAGISIDSLEADHLVAKGLFGPFEDSAHGEGLDLKAVTYAAALVEALADGRYRARLVFDI